MAMVAFAGNSILCRMALAEGAIDAVSFTVIRLFSGSAVLLACCLIANGLSSAWAKSFDWRSSATLFVYAIGFSYAYVSLEAGTGALILFAAVQLTMLGYGYLTGDRLSSRQGLGFVASICGLVYLLSPGSFAPPLSGAVLMLCAGVAWGVYSLRGRGTDPLHASTANFLGTLPLITVAALVIWLIDPQSIQLEARGVWLALASGACASALGYIIWYAALATLKVSSAATVQLSVPVLAAIVGILVLAEPWSIRLGLAGSIILGGIWVVLNGGAARRPT